MKVSFIIPGEPQGKGRHRTTKSGHSYTPRETVLYENLIKTVYIQQTGSFRFDDNEPLDIRITAYFPIPKSVSKRKRQAMLDRILRPVVKRDWDNIGKVVCDALNNIAYRDDRQIVDATVRKFYSDEPRVVVTISEAR